MNLHFLDSHFKRVKLSMAAKILKVSGWISRLKKTQLAHLKGQDIVKKNLATTTSLWSWHSTNKTFFTRILLQMIDVPWWASWVTTSTVALALMGPMIWSVSVAWFADLMQTLRAYRRLLGARGSILIVSREPMNYEERHFDSLHSWTCVDFQSFPLGVYQVQYVHASFLTVAL